jgi:signal transduction histidine kinase
LPGLALALVLATALGVPDAHGLVTSYAAVSSLVFAVAFVPALTLAVASALAAAERAGAALPALLAIAWLAPLWVGWEEGPPVLRSVAAAAPPLIAALLVQMAAGRRSAAVRRQYAASGLAGAALVLFSDPFTDPDCWRDCTHNVFAVQDAPAAWVVALVVTAAGGVLALVGAARRAPGSRRLWPVLLPVGLAGAGEAIYAVALLLARREDPTAAGFLAIFTLRGASLLAVGLGLVWTARRARRTRAVVARLGVPHSAGLRDVLADALGDPGLQVAYPHAGGWVDAGGAAVTLDRERVLTRIERSGEPVAVVAHDPATLDSAAIVREIGAAARLSADNERLRATVLAQLADLRASRAEVVAAGDATRRRLERDLHDGAQQRLLALSYELRLGGPALADAAAEAQRALEDLRELAHGIYPAILAEAGLRPALESLCDVAPVPVELGDADPARLPAVVETAAYLLAEAAVGTATDCARVDVRLVEDTLLVTVAGARGPVPQRLLDRVSALGGSARTQRDGLEAVIPCA